MWIPAEYALHRRPFPMHERERRMFASGCPGFGVECRAVLVVHPEGEGFSARGNPLLIAAKAWGKAQTVRFGPSHWPVRTTFSKFRTIQLRKGSPPSPGAGSARRLPVGFGPEVTCPTNARHAQAFGMPLIGWQPRTQL